LTKDLEDGMTTLVKTLDLEAIRKLVDIC
jgi:hypothetical protein